MKKHIIIFGGSSFLAQEVFKSFKRKKIKTTSFSRKKKSNNYKTDYSLKSIMKVLSNKIKNDEIPIFIFFNSIPDNSIFKNYLEKNIKKIIEINLTMPIILTNGLLKKYFFQKPKFIFISSSRALKGDKGIALYSTTKNAIKSFSRNIALEYANYDIVSKVIHLGLFKGGLKDKLSLQSEAKILKSTFNGEYLKTKQLINTLEFAINDTGGNGSEIFCDNGYS